MQHEAGAKVASDRSCGHAAVADSAQRATLFFGHPMGEQSGHSWKEGSLRESHYDTHGNQAPLVAINDCDWR